MARVGLFGLEGELVHQVRYFHPVDFFYQELNRLFPSQVQFGVTIGGEYSTGINDCGFYLRMVEPYTPDNPDCAYWDAWEAWDQNTKDGLLNFALASMDALPNPFFWTWKVRKARSSSPLSKVLIFL